MNLQRFWASLGVWWIVYFLAADLIGFPYELAYVMFFVGCYVGWVLGGVSILVLAKRMVWNRGAVASATQDPKREGFWATLRRKWLEGYTE